jgi:hypothetical protein
MKPEDDKNKIFAKKMNDNFEKSVRKTEKITSRLYLL